MTSCLRLMLAFVLAVITAVLFVMLGVPAAKPFVTSKWRMIGPVIGGWDFQIVAMKGDKPVLMTHEWSGDIHHRLAACTGSKRNAVQVTALRANVQSEIETPIVWADTGKADGVYGYYLTKADVARASRLLDWGPACIHSDYTVRTLNDDPSRQRQTVMVTESGDDTDATSTYEVVNNRVRPLTWQMYRARGAAFVLLPLCAVVFVVSAMLWHWVLGKRLPRRTV